jgi:acetyl-CoA C-acetyltransferase
MNELFKSPALDSVNIDEVIIGTARQSSTPSNLARYAQLEAKLGSKLPEDVPAYTVQRQSASGMQAIANGIWAIQNGDADLILAGGADSMSKLPLEIHDARYVFNEKTKIVYDTIHSAEINSQPVSLFGEITMSEIADNIAGIYGLSQVELESYAARSLDRSKNNIGSGIDISVRKGKEVQIVSEDELAAAPCLFASPADGAAVVLLASEESAAKGALPVKAVILSAAISAGSPKGNGLIGAEAVAKAIELANVSVKDIDLFHVLEFSAAQSLAVCKELVKMGLSEDEVSAKVNPHGGALASGNTFGAAGVMLAHDLLAALRESGKRLGLVLTGAEGGQAMALVIETP